MSIHELAERLDNAAREAREIPQFDTQNSLSLEEAYAIQAASVARRVARGEMGHSHHGGRN